MPRAVPRYFPADAGGVASRSALHRLGAGAGFDFSAGERGHSPNFTTSTNNASVNGTSTTIPAVIAVAVCALFATTAIARAALRPTGEPH